MADEPVLVLEAGLGDEVDRDPCWRARNGRALGQGHAAVRGADQVVLGQVDGFDHAADRVHGLDPTAPDRPPATPDPVHLPERDHEVRQELPSPPDQRQLEDHRAAGRVVACRRRGRGDHEGTGDLLVRPERGRAGRRGGLEDEMVGAGHRDGTGLAGPCGARQRPERPAERAAERRSEIGGQDERLEGLEGDPVARQAERRVHSRFIPVTTLPDYTQRGRPFARRNPVPAALHSVSQHTCRSA